MNAEPWPTVIEWAGAVRRGERSAARLLDQACPWPRSAPSSGRG